MASQKIWTKNFISIGLVNLFVFITFYALLTTLPLYVIGEWGISEAKAGLVVTMMLLSAILVRPFSGNLLSLFGKKKMLVIGVCLFTVTTIFYVFVHSYITLLILRFLHGISFAILTTATSAIATDIVPPNRRGEGLGYFTMSMNVAIVIGPFIGLTIQQLFSYSVLLVLLNVFAIISVFCAFIVQNSEKIEDKVRVSWSMKNLFEPKALLFSIIGLLVAFAYASIVSFISVFAEDAGLSHVSGYFFLVFACAMLLSRPFLGRMFDLKGPIFVVLPCMLLFSLGFIGLAFASTGTIFLIASAIMGVGYGSLLPFLLSMIVNKVPASRSGYANATFYTLYDAGVAIGSFVLGLIVSGLGFQSLYFYLAIFVLFIAIFFVIFVKIDSKS